MWSGSTACCLLETLVAAVVPVDAVDHRRETADHEGDFPVTFVVDLPRAGEDAGQRRGLLDVRHIVGRVVYRRIADEIDVRGDGQSQVDLASPLNSSVCFAYSTEKNCSVILIISVFPKRRGRLINVTLSPLSHHSRRNPVLSTERKPSPND